MEAFQAKRYTITEVAKISGLPESTLRYYESIGIIAPIERDPSTKRRVYRDNDINLIVIAACLNAADLSIEDMKTYLINRNKGVLGAGEQAALLQRQMTHLLDELKYSQMRIKYVEAKIKYWQAVETGDKNAVKICAETTYKIADEMKLPRTPQRDQR